MKKFKIDYRHYICISLTLIFFYCAIFVFPYAFARLGESVGDFGTSFAFYFSEMFFLDFDIVPTVTNLSVQPFEVPFNLPSTWAEFEELLGAFWDRLFNADNFDNYLL